VKDVGRPDTKYRADTIALCFSRKLHVPCSASLWKTPKTITGRPNEGGCFLLQCGNIAKARTVLRAQRGRIIFSQPHLQVSETYGSFLTSFRSTTGFPEAVRPDEQRGVGCAFSFGEELRRITRRKDASNCRSSRILQTRTANLRRADSQYLHSPVACTGRRLKYYRRTSECSFRQKWAVRGWSLGVVGILGNHRTVTVQ